MEQTFVFVGSWGLEPGDKGLSIYACDPYAGELTYLNTVHEEISVGCQYFDPVRQILYVTDESGRVRNGTVGGSVLTFRLNQKTGVEDLSETATLLPKPSYFCLEHTRQFALVAHHSNRGKVTKLYRDENGAFRSKTVTDDAGLALFSVAEDGCLGEVMDYVLTPGGDPFGPHALSHEHSVSESPDGNLFLVCDKGMDCVYSFRLDREKGKLTLLHTTYLETGVKPRFAIFHPTIPLVYENNEGGAILNTYHYDAVTGEMQLLHSMNLSEHTVGRIQCADLVLTPDGRRLYASVRGDNTIVVLNIQEDGLPTVMQTVDCGGEYPRGLCILPDGSHLLCANHASQSITAFSIREDGTLQSLERSIPARLPGNMTAVCAHI